MLRRYQLNIFTPSDHIQAKQFLNFFKKTGMNYRHEDEDSYWILIY